MSSEALSIAGHEYTHKYDGHRYVSNAVASETLPDAVALVRLPDVEAVRAQWAAEVERITRERDAAFAFSRCECSADEACTNLCRMAAERDSAQAEAKRLREAMTKWRNLLLGYGWPNGADTIGICLAIVDEIATLTNPRAGETA